MVEGIDTANYVWTVMWTIPLGRCWRNQRDSELSKYGTRGMRDVGRSLAGVGNRNGCSAVGVVGGDVKATIPCASARSRIQGSKVNDSSDELVGLSDVYPPTCADSSLQPRDEMRLVG